MDESGRAGGASVTATSLHPFWVVNKAEWVDAGHLAVGDGLLAADGSVVVVEDVFSYSGWRHVFNLDVWGIDTFHVAFGDEALLVHNCSIGAASESTIRGMLNELETGSTKRIRLVESGDELQTRFMRSVQGGQELPQSSLGTRTFRLSDETRVFLRESDRHGSTIEYKFPNTKGSWKVHVRSG